jgi:type VII secretion-associated protein (TIGR03931 family)
VAVGAPAPTVLEVGPVTVRALSGGSGRRPDDAMVSVAIEGIDDLIALLDDRPVAVADLWRAIMAAILGGGRDSVVVLHPSSWSRARVDRVVAAAAATGRRVVPMSRSELIPGEHPVIDITEVLPAASRRRRRRGVRAALTVAAVLLALGGVVAVTGRSPGPQSLGPRSPAAQSPAARHETTNLVEGRIVVGIPSRWLVQRVTAGPGSRRVQVSAPADPDIAVHITQSYAPETTLAQAAEVLGRAVAGQPAGVFVDFNPAGDAGGRPAVTYREIRAGRMIRWSVLLAGSTRISIGCQSPPGREDDVSGPCEQAMASAREAGTTAPG